MKKTRKLAFLPLLVVTMDVNAGYVEGATIQKLYGAKDIIFGADNAPATSTCDFYGRHFRFDATTEEGKNMLSIILAAHMGKKKIDIWYSSSPVSGETALTTCNESKLAVVSKIGFTE